MWVVTGFIWLRIGRRRGLWRRVVWTFEVWQVSGVYRCWQIICFFSRAVFDGGTALYLLPLIKHYNLYKVLPSTNTFLQLSVLCANFFQLRMFMLFISSKTSSSQRVLGLQIDLLDMGLHLLIFCTILSSAICSTWPNHLYRCTVHFVQSFNQQTNYWTYI